MWGLPASFRARTTVAIFALSIGVIGCGPSAVDFNQKLVESNNRLKSAGDMVLGAIQMHDFGSAKTRLESCKKVVEDIRTDMKTWKVPSRQAAKDLNAGFEKYLKGQEEILNQWGKAIAIAENQKLSGPEIQRQLKQIDDKILVDSNRDLDELKKLQKAFADDYHITLR